jgi:hypothetical protein
MSLHDIQVFNPRTMQCAIAVVDDELDLNPLDRRFAYVFELRTRPAGSKATFDGSKLKIDRPGDYVAEVTAGSDTARVPIFAFTKEVYDGLTPSSPGEVPYDDVARRRLLQQMLNSLPREVHHAWNAGKPPAVDLRKHGGR